METRPKDTIPIVGHDGEEMRTIPETWYINLLKRRPETPHQFRLSSTYHTPLGATEEQQANGGGGHVYGEMSEWYEIGLGVLLAAGWLQDPQGNSAQHTKMGKSYDLWCATCNEMVHIGGPGVIGEYGDHCAKSYGS